MSFFPSYRHLLLTVIPAVCFCAIHYQGSLSDVNVSNLKILGNQSLYTTSYYPNVVKHYALNNNGIPEFKGSVSSYGLNPIGITSLNENYLYICNGDILNQDTPNISYYSLSPQGSPSFKGTVSHHDMSFPNYIATNSHPASDLLYLENMKNSQFQVFSIDSDGRPAFIQSLNCHTNDLNSFIISNPNNIYITSSADSKLIHIETRGQNPINFVEAISSYGVNPSSIIVKNQDLYVLNTGKYTDPFNGSNLAHFFINPSDGSLKFLGTYSTRGVNPVDQVIANDSLLIISNQGYLDDQNNLVDANISCFKITKSHPIFLGTISSLELSPQSIDCTQSNLYVITQNLKNGHNNLSYYTIDNLPFSYLPTNFKGPGAITAQQLNNIMKSGKYSPDIDQLFYDLLFLNNDSQLEAITNSGSQYKILQYEQEKLDLLLHKQLDDILYDQHKESSIFLFGGADFFQQSSCQKYPGYKAQHYYQFLGINYKFVHSNALFAFGGSESYDYLTPTSFTGKSAYNSLWSTVGLSSFKKNWQYGCDLLFSYSFINTSRKIKALNISTKSDHNMWSASIEAKTSYNFRIKKAYLNTYDNLGYIYGHENNYTEKGSGEDLLKVFNENLSAIRNQYGLCMQSLNSYKKINVFLDTAWIFEYYFNSQFYTQQFIGSDIQQKVRQPLPTKNYGRIFTGLKGLYKHLNWQLSYTGLFGHHLQDSSFSAKFNYEF
jgi:hypothetical protein